jgi:hypothetical protein
MQEPWDSAGKRVQSLARRQEVQHLWPRLAIVLEALGRTLVDAGHDMEQLSADGPLQQAPDFQIAFERRVLATLSEATTNAAKFQESGPGGRPLANQRRPQAGTDTPRASALP